MVAWLGPSVLVRSHEVQNFGIEQLQLPPAWLFLLPLANCMYKMKVMAGTVQRKMRNKITTKMVYGTAKLTNNSNQDLGRETKSEGQRGG